MTQPLHCQSKSRETSTALSWAGFSLLQEGSAATPACENDLLCPPKDVRDICRCRVVCGLRLQAGTETGSVFSSCSCTCGGASSGLGEPPA